MNRKTTLLVGLLSLALIMPVVSKAGCGSCGGGSGHKHEGSMSKDMKKDKKCHKKGPGSVAGAKVDVKEVKDGVVITITGKDKKTIKAIQERAKACPACKDKKACTKCKDGKKCEKCKAKKECTKCTSEKKCPKCEAKAEGETVTCPVMGNKIKKGKAVDTAEYKGKTYYFCCAGCKPAFLKDPEKYVKK